MKSIKFFIFFLKMFISISVVRKNMQNLILPNQFNAIDPFRLRNEKGETITFTIKIKCSEDVRKNIEFKS